MRRAAHYAANEIPVWAWLIVVVLLFLVCSGGCVPKPPPPVFALAVEPLPTMPPPVPAGPTADACAPGVLLPGQPAPGVVVERGVPVATCRAQVVPDDEVLACFGAEDDAEAWQALARIQHDARAADRALCEDIAAERYRAAEDWRTEARTLRWAGYGLGLAGVVVGLAVGFVGGTVTQ